MARWGVDAGQIDTEEYDDAIAAVDDAISSLRAVNEDIEALHKIGINLNTMVVGGCDDAIAELEQIREQIETAEEKYIDSFRANNSDFM